MDILSGIDLLTNVKSMNIPEHRYESTHPNIHVHISDPPTNTNSCTNALVMHRSPTTPQHMNSDGTESIDDIIDMTMPDSESSGEYASSEDITPPPQHARHNHNPVRNHHQTRHVSISSSSNGSDEEYAETELTVDDRDTMHHTTQPVYSREEMETQKRQLLYRLDRLEKKGIHMHKRFSMNDSLSDMQAEYDRLKLNRDIDGSIRMQRRMLVAIVTGIEFLNNKFDPLDIKLNGWSDSINENIDDYDDVFEDLFLKYRGKAKMAPELNLMLMVGGSGLMFHITNSMFRSSNLPDLADVMKRNPDLMRQFTQATMETMHDNGQYSAPPPPPTRSGGGGGALGGIMNMFFGGKKGGGSGGHHPHPPQQQQHSYHQHTQPSITVVNATHTDGFGASTGGGGGGVMRGPKNVDEILKELKRDAALPPPSITAASSPAISRMSSGSLPSLGELLPSAPAPKKAAAPRKRNNAAKSRSTLDI
jgi:hypothetical protein